VDAEIAELDIARPENAAPDQTELLEECQTFRTTDFSYCCENFSFFHIFKQSIEGGD